MRYASLALLALIAVAATADAGPSFPVCPETTAALPARTITVTGTATLEVTPDLLDVHMSLTQNAARPQTAITNLRGRQAQLVKALPAGVEVKLSNLTLYPVTDEKGRPNGYQAALQLTATTKIFDQLGDIAEAAADANATGLSTAWRRSDLLSMKDHVRVLALQAAASKADETAKTLHFNVGVVDTVVESAGGYWGGEANVSNAVENNTVSSGGVDPSATSLTVTVTVTYQIA